MNAFTLRQSLLLFLTAFIWGCSFVAQAVGMDHVGPFTFTACRTLLGALFLTPLVLYRRKRETAPAPLGKTFLLGAFFCGLCLFAGESFQQFGLVHDTEVGKAGFITSLYIVIVPLLGLFVGHRVHRYIVVGVLFAVAGLWELCMTSSLSIELGDLYVLTCALAFSIHILVIAHFVTKIDGVTLAWGQFWCGGLIALFMALVFETPTWEGIHGALLPILWAGIMSNGIAYTLQVVGQRGMNPTVASLIMSLESVVSVLAGWVLLNEVLTTRELFGCALMAVAIVLAQLPAPKKRSKA